MPGEGLSEAPTALAAALADRYELRGLLGRGGMASVYLARDRRHQRDVALKVLQSELTASLGTQRFLKEIEIVAQLSHPHVLALFDSGAAADFVYYVMPYIEGGSLRAQIWDKARMSVSDAIAVAAPVADALEYAHSMGVLHRDIKPENILFSHGHAIVADFGIARAVSSATSTPLTRTGLALGTPGYMSPEQAAGFMDLDGRTDVFSLAVVVYEMIVGEIPGRWPSEDAVRQGRFLEAPLAHRAALAAAGPVVECALTQALAIHEEQRTSSPAEFIADLRGTSPRKRVRPTDNVAQPARMPEIDPAQTKRLQPLYPATRNRFAGGPGRILYDRVVNAEIAESDFPVMVHEIRRVMGHGGTVSQLGKSFSWSMLRRTGAPVAVSVTVRAGTTRITVSENLGTLAGLTMGPLLFFGGGVGGTIIGAALMQMARHGAPVTAGNALMVVGGWVGLMYALGRVWYGSVSKGNDEQDQYLIQRLSDLITDILAESNALPRNPK